ncbi:hypothetical protein MYX77_02190 [Acidobacteriia bacterium AH_259_A11_L15]|nr:hypothetical protein [Acidobacteriia bacterium AH_259_A11_L15]
MFGTYDLVVALLSVVISLGLVVVCLRHKVFLPYFILNLYILISAVHTLGTIYFIRVYGYDSLTYFYFYYTADAMGSMIGYLLIASFFDKMLRDSVFRPYVRPTLAIFFLLVVGVSALFVFENYSRLATRFVIELQQNMFFVGVVLTFLLWLSMSYLRAESRRFVLLVSGLGIYFSAHAANYALRFFFRASDDPTVAAALARIPPLAYILMVSLWLYTFWRVQEGEAAVEPIARGRPEENLVKVHLST